MKNRTMKKGWIIVAILSVAACSSPSASTQVEEAKDVVIALETLAVNTAESTVAWKGTKPNGDGHTGTVAIKEGKLGIENSKLVGGGFVLDMTQLDVTDEGIDAEDKAKLIGHLGNGDFFEVEKYPTASFEVTSATADSMTGNLTIKEVSKSITVPYVIEATAHGVIATSSFSIDRTVWGVTFNSGNFFKDLGNYMIDDVISFVVVLKTASE